MGNVRGFDSYGQDMFYETKGGIWMPKETEVKAQPKTKAVVPLGKRPPLPSMQEVLDRQFGKRQVIDLGYNYTDLSAQKENARKALENARKAEKGARFQGTSQHAMDKLHNIGIETDATKYFRELEAKTAPKTQVPNSAIFPSANAAEYGKMLAENPLSAKGQIVPLGGGAAQGNTAPKAEKPAPKASAKPASNQSMAGTIEKQGDKFVADVNGKKRAFSSEKMAQKYVDHELRKAAPLGDVTKQNQVEAPKTTTEKATVDKAENKKAPAKGKTRLSNAVIDEKVEAYRKAMEKQGLKGEKLEQQVARYREGLLAERKKHFNKVKGKVKGKNIAKERAQGKLKVKPKKTGAFAKIGKFFKGKGGKVAAIAAGVAALGAGLYALLGGKDKKVEETPAENPELLIAAPPADGSETVEETAPTEETDPVAVVPADGETTEETIPTEETTTEPAYQPIVKLNEDGSYTTQKGDNFYKLAENLLKDYCKQNGLEKEITGYSPEVKYLAEKIMTDNNYWYDFSYTDDRKRPSAPMLHPNVTLKLPEIKDFIEKKVDLAA